MLILTLARAVDGGRRTRRWPDAFKIYVNGNIRAPRLGLQSKSLDKQQILPFELGAYRIVLRGKDVSAPHRLESNTLHFNIAGGERLTIVARLQDPR